MSLTATRSSTLCMVWPISPNSATGQISLMKRASEVPPAVMQQVRHALSVSATGSPETLRRQFAQLIAQYRPDELILAGAIHDPSARIRSHQICAQVLAEFVAPQAQAS